ncbi:MAG: cation transporter [Betaproteobacteria bacterium]
MSESCCNHNPDDGGSRYRAVLWIALAVNAAMFFVEIAASAASGSSALAADAVDFAADATNYGLSLGAIAAGGLWASRAALMKGYAMGLYGVGVLAYAGWRLLQGNPPEAVTMGIIGSLALAANLGVAWLLYAYREGNANMRSVWLCTRNDLIGNLAVLAAAAGVFGTGAIWPDIAVATVMAGMALASARTVSSLARKELDAARPSYPVQLRS